MPDNGDDGRDDGRADRGDGPDTLANDGGDANATESSRPRPVSGLHDRLIDDDGGRYQLGERLASGGMGDIMLCRDSRIGRDVALKLLTPQLNDDARARARFLREARVQGQLEHPAIVPVYDIDVDEDGNQYFTMRRLQGKTLARILADKRAGKPGASEQYSMHKLLGAFQQVCLAVEYAHTRGVVHRDIKPTNIMLGEFGEVYLLDWGLAKVSGADEVVDDDETPGDTQRGPLLGTPGYMPPEQIACEEVDGRTDVYALGAVLFEILTLEMLNPGESGAARMYSAVEGADASLAARAPELDLGPELEAICVKATEFSPEDRFPSARALHDELQAFLDGQRNLSLRHGLASAHAAAAREALSASDRGGNEAHQHRAAALREIGQAIALAPEDDVVKEMLNRLLTQPPDELPEEAAKERLRVLSMENRETGIGAVITVAVFVACLVTLPPIIGVKSWAWIAAIGLPLVLSGAMARRYIGGRRSELVSLGAALFGCLGVAAASGIFGPLLFAPSFAVTVSIIASAAPGTVRRSRLTILGLVCLSILAPTLLSWLHVLPQFYSFRDNGILIISQALRPTRIATDIGLLITDLVLIIVPTTFVWRVRDANEALNRQLILHKWHLQKLVPTGGRT